MRHAIGLVYMVLIVILGFFLRKKIIASRFLLNCVVIWNEMHSLLSKAGLVRRIELKILFSYSISSVVSLIVTWFLSIYMIFTII